MESVFYFGKIGADNAILLLIGGLFFVRFFLRKLSIDGASAFFFVTLALFHDLYRVQSLRGFLLLHTMNFQKWEIFVLVWAALPLYICLLGDISQYVIKKYHR